MYIIDQLFTSHTSQNLIMKRTVYLNGEYLPEDEARISIFDRAVLFGDAIYEVAGVLDGKLIDFEARSEEHTSELQSP